MAKFCFFLTLFLNILYSPISLAFSINDTLTIEEIKNVLNSEQLLWEIKKHPKSICINLLHSLKYIKRKEIRELLSQFFLQSFLTIPQNCLQGKELRYLTLQGDLTNSGIEKAHIIKHCDLSKVKKFPDQWVSPSIIFEKNILPPDLTNSGISLFALKNNDFSLVE